MVVFALPVGPPGKTCGRLKSNAVIGGDVYHSRKPWISGELVRLGTVGPKLMARLHNHRYRTKYWGADEARGGTHPTWTDVWVGEWAGGYPIRILKAGGCMVGRIPHTYSTALEACTNRTHVHMHNLKDTVGCSGSPQTTRLPLRHRELTCIP